MESIFSRAQPGKLNRAVILSIAKDLLATQTGESTTDPSLRSE
jgi:hypothetical protein